MKRRTLFSLMILLSLMACITQPDQKSGGDGERYQAKKIELGQAVTDTVAWAKGDRTDWKVLNSLDPGVLKVQLIVDKEDAQVVLELYDRYGKFLAKVTRHRDGPKNVQLLQEITPGKYFIKIYSKTEDDNTGYTLITSLMGE